MLSILALVAVMADPATLTPGDHRRTVTVDSLDREFLVHVPPKHDGKQPAAVLLIFHGGGSNARQMAQFCGMNDKADEAGFIAVYPNGTGRAEGMYTWNAGNCCGYAERRGIDDVGFVKALLDDLGRALRVDSRRVYATGMSNGGMMSYRLADELSERIAAIASVGGPMGAETCLPKRPVPVIHFHGTDDLFAPYTGGKGERSISRIHFYSVEHTIANWARANGCPSEAAVTELEPVVDDGTKVTRSVYGPGKEGAEVVLYTIKGGGHTWPGRRPTLKFLGPSTRNVAANDLIWEFFEKHPQPAERR